MLSSQNRSGGWCGVSYVDGSCAVVPKYASWSWQMAMLGIGCFMIVIIIKRLTMALLHHKGKIEPNKILEGVVIFHQSTTPQAFQFYWSCGFKQINHQNEINCELLPPSL
jgi:hypothetical protein